VKVDREQFLTELTSVKPGLSNREFLEQSSCFCFQNGELLTFNDQVCCRRRTCFPLTGAVRATLLTEVLQKIPDPYLEVEEKKGEFFFSSKRRSFALAREQEIILPIDHVPLPRSWAPLNPKLMEALPLVGRCISQSPLQYCLTCIHLHPKYVESCDNYQAMRFCLNTGLDRSILVEGKSLLSVTQIDPKEIALSKTWIHFRNAAGLVFSARCHMEEYPNLFRHLKVSGKPVQIPRTLSKAGERAALFVEDKVENPLLHIELKQGRISIKGEGTSGWFREARGVHYEGPPLSFLIQPSLFAHITTNYTEAYVDYHKIIVDGGLWRYVSALVTPSTTTDISEKE
jgi:hypothetical protein